MNRLSRWSAPVVELPELELSLEPPDADHAAPRGMAYASFAPLQYEPNYAYPLLVWLHGPGDDERQLCRVMPHISLRNYVGVGPRGCCPPSPGGLGFEWGETADALQSAADAVADCIEAASRRYHIAADRVFLAGYQSGGTMALRLALQDPERLAGVISVAGPFPVGRTPLARLRQIRELPIFLAHGRESTLYPFRRVREELRLFHAADLHVHLRQYPCGDELTTQMLLDVNAWIMERITGVPEAATDDVCVQPGDANENYLG